MLWVGEHEIEPLAPKLYDARYILRSNRDASQAWVEVYDPLLNRIAGPVNGPVHALPQDAVPKDIDWNHAQVSADLQYASDQPYRFVFWARDNFPDYDKAHRKKLALTNQAQQWRGWFMGFGFKYSRGNFISGLPPLTRELDSTRMPSEIASIVENIVVMDPKTGKLRKELGYSHKWLLWFSGSSKPVEELLIYTQNIGAQGFADKINLITTARVSADYTGIIYFCGHGGYGRLIGIPDNAPDPKELFGIGRDADVDVSALQDLRRVRVVYLGSCKTCSDSKGTGLVQAINQRGAWAVVGFHIDVEGRENPPSRKADIQFFKSLAGSTGGLFGKGKFAGKTVQEAAQDACKYVEVKGQQPKNWWEVYGIAGNPNTRLW